MNKESIAILIVDDEPEARDLLVILLRQIEGIRIVGMAENVDVALSLVDEKSPDLILLDIQMPGKNGFELVSKLRETGRDTGYIFITAFDDYAIRALRATAFDYLLKPVDPKELSRAIGSFREEWKRKVLSDSVDNLLSNLGIGRRLKLNTRTGFMVINPMDIVYCLADGNYTEIILAKDRREIISSNLGSLEKELAGKDFFRVSRSALISLRYLTHVDNKAGTCRLQTESVIELKVARNRLSTLASVWESGNNYRYQSRYLT